MSSVTRRTFLGSVPFWSLATAALLRLWRPSASYPFTLGVASGEPAADGFVIWTRLAPHPTSGGGMPPEPVEVSWEVARDYGLVDADGRRPDWGTYFAQILPEIGFVEPVKRYAAFLDRMKRRADSYLQNRAVEA